MPRYRPSNPIAWTSRLLSERTILIVMVLFFGGAAVVLWRLSAVSSSLQRAAAMEQAETLSSALREFRTLYTREVVEPARAYGMLVTHDYQDNEGAIPLPATISMKLGREITPGGARLYSDFPFPSRTDGGPPRDDFEHDALDALRENPLQPYYSFEAYEELPSLRYATADIMRPSCVECHNTHPDSPKTDWKVGDVRGVLEVIVPLEQVAAHADAQLGAMFIMLTMMALTGFGVIAWLLGSMRRSIAAVAMAEPEGRAAWWRELATGYTGSAPQIAVTTLGLLLASLIFVIDISTPRGVAAGVLYVLIVLVSLWSQRKWHVYGAATTGTVLTLLGFVISPAGGELWKVLANRLLTIFAIWLTAILCLWQIRRTAERSRLSVEKELAVAHSRHLGEAQLEAEQARETAEAANRTKSQFLAIMSHELRTPLNGILGYCYLLNEQLKDLGQESLRLDVGRIHTCGDHLLELINDILDLSKIEAGKMQLELETFDVGELVADIVETVEPMAPTNDNSFHLDAADGLGSMRADLRRTRQIVLNLLSNACKFTEHGDVTLSVRRPSTNGVDCLEFVVSDTGIGMSNEQMEHIFDEFVQADTSTTREYGGTGLGLTICQRLCTMMGGSIEVTSELGTGSTFMVVLPAEVPDVVTTAPDAHP